MISYEEFTVIHTLHKKGYSIRKIAQIVGLDRRTVSKMPMTEYPDTQRILNRTPRKRIFSVTPF